jgi:hypothetical protein
MGEHGATESNQISVSSLKPKLPKLTLPKLKGQVTKWGPFWDSYNSAIHNKCNFKDRQIQLSQFLT